MVKDVLPNKKKVTKNAFPFISQTPMHHNFYFNLAIPIRAEAQSLSL